MSKLSMSPNFHSGLAAQPLWLGHEWVHPKVLYTKSYLCRNLNAGLADLC